ncbi:hypothetical protein QQX53_22395, partial [Klebsiella pneumoniae]
KACVLPENPASYRVVRTKSYLFNKAGQWLKAVVEQLSCIHGPALVLTASHYETRMVANQLGEVSQPVYIQKAGQALSEIIK